MTRTLAAEGGARVITRTFSENLEGDALAHGVRADGPGSALVRSGLTLLSGTAAAGRRLEGLLVISDGRQTREDTPDELVRRARADGLPVHVVPLGGDLTARDLSLALGRRTVHCFAGKPVSLRVQMRSRGLGATKPLLEVRDVSGKTVLSREIELEDGVEREVTLELPAPPSGEYRAVIGWRGGEHEPRPVLLLQSETAPSREIAASPSEADAESGKSWTALISLPEAGAWRVQAVDADAREKPGPEAVVTVQVPPTEKEALAADHDFLKTLAGGTGGRVWSPDESATLAREMFARPPTRTPLDAAPQWEPLWPRHTVLVLLCGLFSGEWYWRRRKGLL